MGAGILSLIIGVGLILGTSHAAAKIPELPAAKKTFMESLLAFFAGVLAICGGLSLMMIGLMFWEEDLPNDTAGWDSLRTIEQRYSVKDIDDLIESAVQKGMTLQDMCRYYPDCFINYGAMQDIRIVRQVNGEQYFAVLPVSEKNMYSVKLRRLNQDEVNKIAENKITRYELLGKNRTGHP